MTYSPRSQAFNRLARNGRNIGKALLGFAVASAAVGYGINQLPEGGLAQLVDMALPYAGFALVVPVAAYGFISVKSIERSITNPTSQAPNTTSKPQKRAP